MGLYAPARHLWASNSQEIGACFENFQTAQVEKLGMQMPEDMRVLTCGLYFV